MVRSKSALRVLWFWLFVALVAFAQRGSRSLPNQVETQVQVTYLNERPAPQLLRVELLNSSGVSAMETLTNDLGQAHFRIMGQGNFRVKVSGMGIEDAVSDDVQIAEDDRNPTGLPRRTANFPVSWKRLRNPASTTSPGPWSIPTCRASFCPTSKPKRTNSLIADGRWRKGSAAGDRSPPT